MTTTGHHYDPRRTARQWVLDLSCRARYAQCMVVPAELIEKARADLAKAEAAERRAEEALQSARENVVRLRHFLETCEQYSTASRLEGGGARQTRRSKSRMLVDAAVAILVEQRKPMSISEIAAALNDRGFELGGEKPHSNLAGLLSREKDRLRYERGVGWMPTEARTPVARAARQDAPSAEEPVAGSLDDLEDRRSLERHSSHSTRPADVEGGSLRRESARPRIRNDLDDLDDEIPF